MLLWTVNQVKLKVCGHKILLKVISLEDDAKIPQALLDAGFAIKSGLDKGAEFRAKSELTIGTIMAIGPHAWKHPDLGDGTPWAKQGDTVMFAKYSGKFISDPKSNDEYYLCNDEDIQVILDEGAK